ncbi:hypothetical protein GCM10023186_22550 [Hymenobacter koreensis]|uniref:Uncharacterized protein n=1 Tax=Hymenobacter koreensis TaxID=1084523 RepID=A0ABP8J0I3_9BACT
MGGKENLAQTARLRSKAMGTMLSAVPNSRSANHTFTKDKKAPGKQAGRAISSEK